MKYVFDKNGIVNSENTERLVQYSVNANILQVAFTDLNIKEYVPYVAFERADGKVSPLIGMAFTDFELNGTKYIGASYSFSDSWVTAQSSILKVAVILKKNNVNARTSTFNLNVAESISEDNINYIDDVAYNELVGRIYQLETKFENGYVERAEKDSLGNVIHETYETKNDATNKLNEAKQYADSIKPTKVSDLTQDINYALKEELPTKTSQLANDSGFITNIVDNLTNYYLKSETFTKDEVRTLIAGVSTLDIRVVSILPSENISSTTIYLLATTDTEENNVYEEYIYANNRWELLGNTKVDLSDYAKISQLPTKVSDLMQDVDYALRNELPKKVSDLTQDVDYATIDFVKEEISNIEFNNNGTNDYNKLINKPFFNSIIPDETATNNYHGEEAIWKFTNEDWFELPEGFSYPNGSSLIYSFKDSVGNQFDAYQFSFVSGENNLKKIIISGRILGGSSIEIFNSSTKTGLAYDNDNYYITTSPTANASIKSSLPLVAMVCINKPTFNNGELVASEKYVEEEIAKLVGTAPETLDTIEELAAAFKENDDIIKAIPTKVSQLENDANYLSSYYTYEETPTKLMNGVWRFQDMPDGYEKGLGSFSIKFRDNLGHTFENFTGAIEGDSTILIIYGRTLDGKSIILYKQGISYTGEVETGGLAFNEDGTIKNDYYLVFDQETNLTLLDKILEAGVLKKYDSIYMTYYETYDAFYDKSNIDGKVEDLRNDLLDKAVVDFDILPTGGTTVPNNGSVDKVYFNHKLSMNSSKRYIYDVLDKYYNEETGEYKSTVDLLVTSDNSIHLQIYDNYDDEPNTDYQGTVVRELNSNTIIWTDKTNIAKREWGTNDCWNPNVSFINVFNMEVMNTYNGNDVGTYNDLLKNFFSIAPYIVKKEKGVLGRLDGKLYHYLNDEWKPVGVDQEYVDKTIGDIEAILDQLNGEVA